MARYKRPRKINPISLVLLLAGGAVVYALVMFGPCYWRKWQVKRVLDDTALTVYRSRRDIYGSGDEEKRDRAEERIRGLGVGDPSLRVYIERGPKEIRVGAEYREKIEHPLVGKTTFLILKPEATLEVDAPVR